MISKVNRLQIASFNKFQSSHFFSCKVQATLAGDEEARRSIVAAEIQNTCSDQSLKTMMEICIRCLKKDPSERPSIEDVLWNLQFAAQVQDAWQGGECLNSSRGSPVSPPRLPRFRLTYH